MFCLNVTQWLLWRCVHSHTTHRPAALQIVHASSYPTSAVRETFFEGFYYFAVGFFSVAKPTALPLSFINCHKPFTAYWQDLSSDTFVNHISSPEFQMIARQIRHWSWRSESGHPSIKWRAAEKVREQFVCLHSNRQVNQFCEWKCSTPQPSFKWEMSCVASSLCTYQTDVRLLQPYPLPHMSFHFSLWPLNEPLAKAFAYRIWLTALSHWWKNTAGTVRWCCNACEQGTIVLGFLIMAISDMVCSICLAVI